MTGTPCGGPRWLGVSSGAGERQAVPVMVPGGWELLLALERGRQSLWWSLVAGTALGGLWELWLHWYCAGGAVGSPGFASTVLGAVGSPGFAGTVLGGCGEPWL